MKMLKKSTISDIYASTTRQQPVKKLIQCIPWEFPHTLNPSTTSFLLLSFTRHPSVLIILLFLFVFLLHSPKTHGRLLILRLLTIISRELVASQVHLPARDAVNNPRVAIHMHPSAHVRPRRNWSDELGVRLRPLVEIDVGGADRNARVTCVVYTAGYANGSHIIGSRSGFCGRWSGNWNGN